MRCACLLMLMACGPVPDEGVGLLGSGLADPFPSRLLIDESGHVDIPPGALLEVEGHAMPVERTAWRTGFSVAQPMVLRLPGVDPGALPSWRAPTPGEGGVRLLDVTDGVWLPVMAELDAWPDQVEPTLIARPLVALTPGHDVALVVTTEAAPRPERFDALLSRRPPASLEPFAEGALDLMDNIEAAGLAPEQVAFAMDFPIDDGLLPTRSALEHVDGSAVTWTLEPAREGDGAPAGAWRTVRGTFTAPSVLDADGLLRLGPDGSVSAEGTVQADLWIHLPLGVEGAAAGTVPVMLFGHGLFRQPSTYLDGDEISPTRQLSLDGGTIIVATSFRGLSQPDLALALSVANDFSKVPTLTGQLVQSQVNLRALAEALASGALLDDPAFDGVDGQSLPQRHRRVYYGISLGGIQGALATGLGLPVDGAVLHVPGSMWMTMLERSSNFAIFEQAVSVDVDDPADRLFLYAWAQLHWDNADPIGAMSVEGRPPTLLQESLHDEQVPNLTTRAMARTAGWPAVGPVSEAAWGLDVVAGPTGPGRSAWVQFDPGKAAPAEQNRPAEVTGAHELPRTFPGQRRQTLEFLVEGQEGTVIHPCGDAPCGPDNPG